MLKHLKKIISDCHRHFNKDNFYKTPIKFQFKLTVIKQIFSLIKIESN